MRARMKRRQRIRRITIVGTILIVGVSLAVGIYLVSTAQSPLAPKIGTLVASPDMASLYSSSLVVPYGQPPDNATLHSVISSTGSPYLSGTKPIVVYIGAEFCPYCAAERWPLIISLMRFGNFSNLHYTLSSGSDVYPNSPTFTFVGSTYTSKYVVFQPYENEDRNRNPLQSVPSNYSAPWQAHGAGYPFLNFGNRYISPGSTVSNTISGENWTQVLRGIASGDSFGLQVKKSANLMTSLICKLTDSQPSRVCHTYPIATTSSGIAAPTVARVGIVSVPSRASVSRNEG
ncbi:MAG: DUF929 domain-containing protein [Thaumarchaeota archaeon]|nr:DUF929 domain-containing protein [Nitrososphaerota archaeon]